MIISFLGHSNFIKTETYEEKMLLLLEEKVGDAPANFYLGGYGDFDYFAFECCKKYKSKHPSVSLIFVTPYITVEYQKHHLNHQKERYDSIVYPEIENKPIKFAIIYRNRWMVEQADFIVCYIDHEWAVHSKPTNMQNRKRNRFSTFSMRISI